MLPNIFDFDVSFQGQDPAPSDVLEQGHCRSYCDLYSWINLKVMKNWECIGVLYLDPMCVEHQTLREVSSSTRTEKGVIWIDLLVGKVSI